LVILFVGFSDDRGLIFIWFDVAVLVVIITIIIIVVWVSRRHRVAYDEDAPVGQTGGKALGGACGHVRAPVDVATFTLHRNAVRAVHRYLFVFLSQQRRPHCTALLREGEFSSGVALDQASALHRASACREALTTVLIVRNSAANLRRASIVSAE
jgi:hypothetical protein